MTAPITIHTDGSCMGNPGPGGFATILEQDNREFLTVTGGDPSTTNNRMELSAVIEALRAVNSIPEMRDVHVTIRSDSTYVTNAFNKGWLRNWTRNNWTNSKRQPVPNRERWQDLLAQIKGHQHSFVWVRGHSGDPMNERCDRLALLQARNAHAEPLFWSRAGNPKYKPTEHQTKPPELLSQLAHSYPAKEQTPNQVPVQDVPVQDVIERNDISTTALELAVARIDQGNHAEAKELVQKALRHLTAQRKLLTGDPLPF